MDYFLFHKTPKSSHGILNCLIEEHSQKGQHLHLLKQTVYFLYSHNKQYNQTFHPQQSNYLSFFQSFGYFSHIQSLNLLRNVQQQIVNHYSFHTKKNYVQIVSLVHDQYYYI